MVGRDTYKEFLVFHLKRRRHRLGLKPASFNLFALFLLTSAGVIAQELEPRSLTNVPVGSNFALLGYSFAGGNILFDPTLPLEDVQAKTHAIVGAYIRAVNFFGMGAKANIILPFAAGDWDGIFQGNDTATARKGLGDLRFGFSFNFLGSPALDQGGTSVYEQKTIAGFSMQVLVPTGQYFDDRLINLGSNRWAFRPQVGVSHKMKNWYLEYYLNAWLFTTNSAFWDGNTLKQKPIGNLKVHLIKAFKKGIWVSLGAGYAYGGRTTVNGVKRDASISVLRLGAIAVVPLHPQHSLKLTLLTSRRFAEGADFDSISLTYQYVWKK